MVADEPSIAVNASAHRFEVEEDPVARVPGFALYLWQERPTIDEIIVRRGDFGSFENRGQEVRGIDQIGRHRARGNGTRPAANERYVGAAVDRQAFAATHLCMGMNN